MTALRRHLITLAVLALCTANLAAQTDSIGRPPDLGGFWRLSGPGMFGSLMANFTQNDNHLTVDIVTHGQCDGRDVKIDLKLYGAVALDTVRFWGADRRLEGEPGNSCDLYAVFEGRIAFVAPLSPDKKKFQGTYDFNGGPSHLWVFSR